MRRLSINCCSQRSILNDVLFKSEKEIRCIMEGRGKGKLKSHKEVSFFLGSFSHAQAFLKLISV